MKNIQDKPIDRQPNRFNPQKDDPYYELNFALTKLLDSYGGHFKNKHCLDFGCGERSFAKFFNKYEINTVNCDVSQNKFGTVDVIIQANEKKLPFEDGAFEGIFMFDVLEHIPNDVEVLSELYRVMKNDGMLILSIPFMYRFHEIPNDYRRYTPSGLKYILECAGFSVKKIEPIGSIYFVVDTLLRESKSNFTGFFAPFIRRLAMKIFLRMRNSSEPCFMSSFSYFVVANK